MVILCVLLLLRDCYDRDCVLYFSSVLLSCLFAVCLMRFVVFVIRRCFLCWCLIVCFVVARIPLCFLLWLLWWFVAVVVFYLKHASWYILWWLVAEVFVVIFVLLKLLVCRTFVSLFFFDVASCSCCYYVVAFLVALCVLCSVAVVVCFVLLLRFSRCAYSC